VSNADDVSSRLSGAAVQREILTEALQHPTTLYPFALAALAATYGIFVAPFLGGHPWALLIALGSGLGSVASFAWRYLIQGESAARARARQLVAMGEEQRRESQEGDLEAVRQQLQDAFREPGSAEGQETLLQLANEFNEVRESLGKVDAPDAITAVRLLASARETYRGGLSALADARALMDALRGLDRAELKAEIDRARAELVSLAKAGAEPERIRLERRTLEKQQRTLELLEQQGLAAERLLHQADLAVAALRRLRVALPALEGVGSAEALQDIYAELDQPDSGAGHPVRPSREDLAEERERQQRA
jgi:hypothetical protein